MATNYNRIFGLSALTALLLVISVQLSYSCNEQVCASIVSKCMLTQSCKCDSKNYSCCTECFKCLGHLQLECCSCLGKLRYALDWRMHRFDMKSDELMLNSVFQSSILPKVFTLERILSSVKMLSLETKNKIWKGKNNNREFNAFSLLSNSRNVSKTNGNTKCIASVAHWRFRRNSRTIQSAHRRIGRGWRQMDNVHIPRWFSNGFGEPKRRKTVQIHFA